MGCDIHLFVEVKKRESFWKPKKWVNADKWTKNKYFEKYEDEKEFEIKYSDRFYTGGRSYNLFSALCGVRSDSFKDNVIPISDPKGIPRDTSKVVRKEIESYGSDGHSHNHNTLDELKNYDWSIWGETCDFFRNEVIPKMEKLHKKYGDVRIVYFFDN